MDDMAIFNRTEFGFSAQFVYELAMGDLTPKEVCEAYGISKARFKELLDNPVFMVMYNKVREEMLERGMTLKTKALIITENGLRMLHDMISNAEVPPSARMATEIFFAKPASASSAALSMTSCTMWVGQVVRVYIPGRSLTGSRSLRTRMDEAEYSVMRFENEAMGAVDRSDQRLLADCTGCGRHSQCADHRADGAHLGAVAGGEVIGRAPGGHGEAAALRGARAGPSRAAARPCTGTTRDDDLP